MNETNQDHGPGDEEVNDAEMFEEEPTAFEPPDLSDRDLKPRPKWLVPAVAAGLVVVLVAAGFGGWKVYESRQHKSAMSDCMESVRTMRSRAELFQATQDRYRDAVDIQADQVEDAKTVKAMQRAIKIAGYVKPQVVVCDASMSTSELHAATDKAKRASDRLEEVDRRYAWAGKDVISSRDGKNLVDSAKALNDKMAEANKLLADSYGKVADNATRDNLRKVFCLSGHTRGFETKDYRDAANALQSAIDQVNASIQQKAQADQQAAEQAAQQQATAQQQSAPSYGGAGAPTQTAPHGGEPSWKDKLNSQKPIGNHGCNPDGSCGIG